MNTALRSALAVAGVAFATQAAATVVLYEHEGFAGQTLTTENQIGNLERSGFNDRASSIVVLNDRWEVCEDARFRGRCVVLRPGRYPSLAALGINDRISSLRIVSGNARIDESRYAPPPVPVYDNHRRRNERVYEVNVTSVRAVVAQAEQRCWIEHQEGGQGRGEANVPGAVVGALLGGVLGHQVGSGRGNDAATVGGAVVGGLVGSNVGRDRDGRQAYGQDVQRCTDAPSQGRTEYWDVTYEFRGEQHRIQTAVPPGPTITVNEQGEPRA